MRDSIRNQTKFIGILTNNELKRKHSKKNYKDRNNFRIFVGRGFIYFNYTYANHSGLKCRRRYL